MDESRTDLEKRIVVEAWWSTLPKARQFDLFTHWTYDPVEKAKKRTFIDFLWEIYWEEEEY